MYGASYERLMEFLDGIVDRIGEMGDSINEELEKVEKQKARAQIKRAVRQVFQTERAAYEKRVGVVHVRVASPGVRDKSESTSIEAKLAAANTEANLVALYRMTHAELLLWNPQQELAFKSSEDGRAGQEEIPFGDVPEASASRGEAEPLTDEAKARLCCLAR